MSPAKEWAEIPGSQPLRLLAGIGFAVGGKEEKGNKGGEPEGGEAASSDAGTGHQRMIRHFGSAWWSLLTPPSVTRVFSR